MATLHIADWTSSLTYASLPSGVKHAAVRSFYNWLGCALGGANHSTVTTAVTALTPLFGRETASILGGAAVGAGSKADASHAALVNGIASHVHDYDDTHLETIIHPTGPVASALLAQVEMLAETQGRVVGGEEFLLALVAVRLSGVP
jgi:aconitate decarboxylase